MKKRNKLSIFITAALLSAAGLASAGAAPPLVGGEVSGSATSMTANANMDKGALTITLAGVVGTDVKAVQITPTPVPDGSTVCLKANGRQSADWRGGHVLGKIAVTPETCSWGSGVVKDGKVTMTAAGACPAGRTEAAAVLSGVIQMPDGKQAWLPHPAPYRVFNAKGVDATAIAFDCTSGKVAPLPADKARVMAKLF